MTERLAYFMFGVQARDYDATPEMTAEAWADPGVRGFWIDQAGAVLGFLAREGAA